MSIANLQTSVTQSLLNTTLWEKFNDADGYPAAANFAQIGRDIGSDQQGVRVRSVRPDLTKAARASRLLPRIGCRPATRPTLPAVRMRT